MGEFHYKNIDGVQTEVTDEADFQYWKDELSNRICDLDDDKLDKNDPITGATKCKITYDANGLVTGGTSLAASDIPSLDASKIGSGTFADARIPNLNTSKLNAGTLGVARGGTGATTIEGIRSNLGIPYANLAAYHNVFYRGKDITAYFNDGTLWNRINGTGGFSLFEDLWVGDWWDQGVQVTAQGSDQGTSYGNIGSRYICISEFDPHYRDGDSDLNYHHIAVVPGQGDGGTQHFGRHRMNATNTTVGGYKGSVMHTSVLGPVATSGKTYAQGGTINEQLFAIYGSHLKTTKELLSNAINTTGYNRFGSNTGCSSGWEWVSCQARLMSEVEVYGSTVWSSSGYDTGNARHQYALFRLCKQAINNRSAYYWLKDVASASYFAYVDRIGFAGYGSASATDACVRPRFILS